MTPEAQRVAIAEVCGWLRMVRMGKDALYDPSGGHVLIADAHNHLPNYLSDLNAIHEAEEHAFVATSQWAKFGHQLQEVCRWHAVGIVPDYLRDLASVARIAHATAAQRSEAFLRATGKWTD